MHPADSAATFSAAVTAAGKTLDGLDAQSALEQMTAFYRDVRAEKCLLDEEGDTLRCHWGVHELEGKKAFRLEFERLFIEPGDEDEDGMSEMSLTLSYAPTAELVSMGDGACQCSLPGEVGEFKKTVLASAPYRKVSGLKPQNTDLVWFPT